MNIYGIVFSKYAPEDRNCLWIKAEPDNVNSLYIYDGGWKKIGTGSGETLDYNDLENKPRINNVVLEGNLTLTVDDELSETSTNPVQNKVVKGAIDALSKEAESGGSVATTGLLQLLLEHPDGSYTLTEEEVQSVFGGIENFHKAVSNTLPIRDTLSIRGESVTTMLQLIYTGSTDDMFAGLWAMDKSFVRVVGLKSNYITMMENTGAVSIAYANSEELFYELPGSIYSITDESTPEELEEILGNRKDLYSIIGDEKLIISTNSSGAGKHSAEIVEAHRYSLGYGSEYFDFKTRDRLVSVNLQGNGDGYNHATVTDITPQPKEDKILMTTNKTVVGAINETNRKLPVYTTVPELTADYTIPNNPTNVEHIYYITIGDTVHNVTGADRIKWVNGIAPVAKANTTLVVSVINNLAVWGEF